MDNFRYVLIEGTIAERKSQEAARVHVSDLEAAVDYLSMMTGIDIHEEEEVEDEQIYSVINR